MNLSLRSRYALPFAAMLLPCGPASQFAVASITIDSTSVVAQALDPNAGLGGASFTFTGTSIPTSTPVDAFHAASNSQNDVSFSTAGAQTILSIVMDHHRGGFNGVSNKAEAGFNRDPSLSHVTFSVDAPTPYLLSGYYNVQGTQPGYQGTHTRFYSSLGNASTSLFNEYREVFSTMNVDYTLGEPGGGSTGSVSGILPAGTYDWRFGARIRAGGDNHDFGADGDGYFTLTLGDPGVVPEAASFFVWGLLGLACCVRRPLRVADHD